MTDGSAYYSLGKAGADIATLAARYVPRCEDKARNEMLQQTIAGLGDGDRQALEKLVLAAKLMDDLYLEQEWTGNAELKQKLQNDPLLLRYFNINQGPWDRLEENAPFIEGVGERPAGANYYPLDMTKDEFNAWVETLDNDERARAIGYYDVIRRDPTTGKLKTVSYSTEYAHYLAPAAKYLKEAADLVSDASLAHFLRLRADAFLNNSYDDSDRAWLDVAKTSPLEITIGPYEVYSDCLFGYKASFEAFIAARDADATQKLAQFSECMQELEDNLPIPQEHKNKLGGSQPIVVVNLLYSGGDRAGPQTAAFNLPNNPVVIKEKGSKMVILKNVQERKFDNILSRICDALIHPDQRHLVSFNSFFTHILAHEMCHGLGPHTIKGRDGSVSSVSRELQECHSAIEEAKADVTGLWALQYLMDQGKIDASMRESVYATFLASQFRSLRFGLNEAHGRGHALQLNFLHSKGAYTNHADTGYWSVNFDKVADAVRELTHDLMVVQAHGDKAGAKEMLEAKAVLSPDVKSSLDKLSSLNIPVDIEAMQLWQ